MVDGTREMANHVMMDYLKARGIINDSMGVEEIKCVIEKHFATISASKLIELFGMTNVLGKPRTANVTPELRNKQSKVDKISELTLAKSSDTIDEDVHDVRGHEDFQTSEVVLEKIQRFAKFVGMIKPPDDITFTEEELVNLEKSKKAFGMVMRDEQSIEDVVDMPVPKIDDKKIRDDTDQIIGMFEGDKSDHTSGSFHDIAIYNLHQIYDRFDKFVKELEKIRDEIFNFQKYHQASAPMMMTDGILVANNNLRIDALMKSGSAIMNEIEERYKDMHTYRMMSCP